MSATGNTPLTTGDASGGRVATYTFTEDAVTKSNQRVTLNDSLGAELVGTKADAASVPVAFSTEGKASLAAILAALIPKAAANGFTSSRVVAGATNNLTSLKGTAGNIVQIDLFNIAAYDVFVKFYNKATAPVVASDTPVWTLPLKAGTGYSGTFPSGKSFATGIAYAITKLQADTDNTNTVAGDVTGAIDWV